LTTALPVGTHSVTAAYSGDASFGPSTSGAVAVTVNPSSSPAGTVTTLTASTTSITAGQPVTFTATVTPNQGTLNGGTVTFLDDGAPLATLPLTTAPGSPALTVPLDAGSHSVTAVYSGDASFTGSTSLPVGVTVAQQVIIGEVTPLVNLALKKGISGGSSQTLTVTNRGGQPLQGPLDVVLH